MKNGNDKDAEQKARYWDGYQLLRMMSEEPCSPAQLAELTGWDVDYVEALLEDLTGRGFITVKEPTWRVAERSEYTDTNRDELDDATENLKQLMSASPGEFIATMACAGYANAMMGDATFTIDEWKAVFARYYPQFLEYCDNCETVAQLCHIRFAQIRDFGEQAGQQGVPVTGFVSFVVSQWNGEDCDGNDPETELPE